MSRNLLAVVLLALVWTGQPALPQIHLVPDQVRRDALAAESRIERMLMVPMRDGVRLATRVYIPKDSEGPFPAILWRSPYDFSEKMVPNPDYPDANLKFALDAIRHGYAFVMQNERGKFYSEGEWEILGRPRTDGHDTLSWIADQPWSNGRVGTIGCSSTAEWIMGLASKPHPAHRAAVPMAAGAGIGRMGPYYEQGNFYRGGAVQLPMVAWLYAEQNLLRPVFPASLSREERIRVARYYDLVPDMPEVDWVEALKHLPFAEVITAAGGPAGIFDEMIRRSPEHADWYRGGLYHDDEDFTVPALWVNSWYDLSVGPNIELFNHVRARASDTFVRDNQFMIVGPTEHCHMYRLRTPHVVGDRDMGNVDIGLDSIVYAFFDRYLKGNDNGFRDRQPPVRYFVMGTNQWKTADEWPPAGTRRLSLFLGSGSGANSLDDDGSLSATPQPATGSDAYVYDPENPAPSIGGNTCCLGSALEPGSFDQRPVHARSDVLVYVSDPMDRNLQVTGPVYVTLFVSSDAPDTDFTIKLLDIEPNGTAWNLDESIQRARFRRGYDTQAYLEPGRVYELRIGPLNTSNGFQIGHRVGLEVSSSSYPRFERNLNTGSENAFETKTRKARNSVHFGPGYRSRVELTVLD
ncbi:MAG: CocE/NonD family hydrolase [Gammaproteobacteria bacterium]|nr:CocE/NonD family hydrolase [Gammaproteobacteria bacterium]MDH4255362.1 CocE/NonD family hydrolase [Gammaproteobacteria bacterium]MDH5311512.1 CocE/NonD family hydrolase [Gammaproteobacteria bacterium]